MKDFVINIKFHYLYRDAGNYKNYGHLIFPNPNNIQIETLLKKLQENLIDSEFFEPISVGVPLLDVENRDEELDHDWYEFEKITQTQEFPTETKTINEFLESFIKHKKIG